MSEANVDLARRGFEAAARGDLDLVAELLADDVRWHGGDPDAEGACRSRGEALEVMRRAFASGGETAELVDVVDAGEKVVVVLRRGGRTVANLTTLRDGKVVEMVHYPDPAQARAAAGL